MKKNREKSSSVKELLFLILIVLLVVIVFVYQRNAINEPENQEPVSSGDIQEEPIPEDININMSVIGDIMCHDSQYKDAYISNSDSYDFTYVFTDVQKYLQTADISVGNLETTFAGKERGYSNFPTFNTPEQLAYNLKTLGIDVLSTANNHSLDKGYKGLVSTLDYLDDAGIAHTGTYRTEEEQNQVLIQNVKGIKVAFLSFTYGTNGIPVPSGKDFCINLIDENLIVEQINLAKEQNPDMICVLMHWGVEYQIEQNKTQDELADFLFKNGVDVILGGHPHVLQPMEKRQVTLEDGSTKDGFVIYSLGNFISGQRDDLTKSSAILNLGITKNGVTGKITIDSATYVPVYMYRAPATGKLQRYKLLDIETNIQNYENGSNTSLDKSSYNTLKSALVNIKKILGEEIVSQESK